MKFCKQREGLSREEKLRRSYYEVLRDELDQFLLEYSLVDSYNNFLHKLIPYPFVELRELKPKARIPCKEFDAHNSFLIIFSEEYVGKIHKKYIRYFDANKITKTNLLRHKFFPNIVTFNRNIKYFETQNFFSLLKSLLPVDYALLIQRNNRSRIKYALTHFHVRIDWPIADASENLAKYLRYISKDLYEKGDEYAENIQKKFFEYYGLPVMAGGRRTAAIIAAQYLKRLNHITTVYVSSSESRNLLRIDEKGISKAILVKLSQDRADALISSSGLTKNSFVKNYVIARDRKAFISILHVQYDYTNHSLPSEGGRLRELKADANWLTVSQEHILPKPTTSNMPPIPYKMIYT